MPKIWKDEIHNPQLHKLARTMTPGIIADVMGFSTQTIRKKMAKIGIKPKTLKQADRAAVNSKNASTPRRPKRGIEYPAEEGIIVMARNILAKRIDVNREGVVMLDGVPCVLDNLMIEANKILKRRGCSQLGRNPKWRV